MPVHEPAATLDVAIHENAALPKLAWLARVTHSARRVVIQHGSHVERGPRWIVEGVWDGPFGDGFHACPHLFGSGVRVTDDSVTLVPACALVDRVVWTQRQDEILASNSLALLLAATNARLIPGHDYEASMYAVTSGIDHYSDTIPTTNGTIHQLYYHNLVITANGVARDSKDQPRTFASFDAYVTELRAAVARLRANMLDSRRRHSVQPLATISRGYDSPAVCLLARDAGVTRCYTRQRSNSLFPALFSRAATDDDGTAIAQTLGLTARYLERTTANELYFLAGSEEPEYVFDGLAADIERHGDVAAVFTGYHGDMIWNLKAFADERASQIIRHDMSGLNLSELRLKAGFFNVAIPFLFARSLRSIGDVSRSAEMKPWRTGTRYDRPIPRRLLTTAGVDGSLFGQRKKAVIDRPDLPATRHLRDAFLRDLRRDTGTPAALVTISSRLNTFWSFAVQAAKRVGWKPGPIVRPADIRWRLYVWAANRLADDYASRL